MAKDAILLDNLMTTNMPRSGLEGLAGDLDVPSPEPPVRRYNYPRPIIGEMKVERGHSGVVNLGNPQLNKKFEAYHAWLLKQTIA